MAGDRVVYEAGHGRLGVLDLRSGSSAAVDRAEGLIPVGDGSRAAAGVERPGGVVLLAPRGVVDGARSRVLGPEGLSAVGVGEVQR